MSASNWAVCPNCAKKFHDEQESKLEAAYGVLTKEDFALLVDEADQTIEETFREDYEIYGAESGTIHVSYSGRCRDCGLALKFDHNHTLDLDN